VPAQNPLIRTNTAKDRLLIFEANRGQLPPDGQYLSRTAHYSVLLKKSAVSFTIPSTIPNIHSAEHFPAGLAHPSPGPPASVTMTFAGSHSKQAPVPDGELGSQSNYFLGRTEKQWIVGVPHYGGVKYPSVYRNIDVRYHGAQEGMEFDFLVGRGGNPQEIRMSFQGQSRLEMNADGAIAVVGRGDRIILQTPSAYQLRNGQRVAVDSSFVRLNSREVGIHVGSYDRESELIIDPKAVYSSYLGGADDEGIFGIAFDREGNIYVAGETSSLNFPIKHAAQAMTGGSYDAFVSKFDRTGSTLIYSTYLGGSLYDHAVGIAIGKNGEAYVAGLTQSPDFPTAHALKNHLDGSYDAFVSKLDRLGSSLLFSTYLGGSGFDTASGLTIDGDDNVFVAGETTSIDFPTTPKAFQKMCGGSSITGTCAGNAFVTKIDSAGTKISYSTYLGGSRSDTASAVAVDGEGAAYVVGQTQSLDFPVKNAFQGTLAGQANAFLTKLDRFGDKAIFSTYLGGSSYDAGEDVAVDVFHNIYLTGFTTSANFPVKNAFQTVQAGQTDCFVTKFSPHGADLAYSTFLGGSGNEIPFRIAVDAAGYASIAGYTTSTDFPVMDAIQPAYLGGNSDAFVTRLSRTGEELSFSTYWGGTGDDYGYAIAKTLTGALWVGGSTSSTDLSIVHPYQAQYAGGPYDAFFSKFALDTKDSLIVLRANLDVLAMQHSLGAREAVGLEEKLDGAIADEEAGDESGVRKHLHQFEDFLSKSAEDRSISEGIASELRIAATDISDQIE
jgi:hypothetical protein